MKLDILAIGVHPDDVELGCAGTLLKHIDLGKKVGILDLTQGELGTRGSAPLRLEEAEKARKTMGALVRDNLKMKDGFFQHTSENLIKIATVVRHYQPEIILANAIKDRHPDHARAAKLTANACFVAGLAKVKTTYQGKQQDRWRPQAVYHYIQDYSLQPDFAIDITGYMDKKIECVLCFDSQFYNPESDELDSPISGKDFLDSVKAKSSVYGRAIGVTFAEGFNMARPVGVRNLFDIF
ncbi:MAG: bacillithiol biosynthesis deacetylase BshB1 [Bacteroidota bacterium]